MLLLLTALLITVNTASEFEFLLALAQTNKAVIVWHDYQEEAKANWPNKSLLFVGPPNCGVCKRIEKEVFENQQFIEAVKGLTCIKTPEKSYKAFLPKNKKLQPPIFVIVDTNGDMTKFEECPIEKNGTLIIGDFLRVLTQLKKEKK